MTDPSQLPDIMRMLREADKAGNVEDATRLTKLATSLQTKKPKQPKFEGERRTSLMGRGAFMGLTEPFRGLTSLINVGLQEAGKATGLPLGTETPFGGLEHGAEMLEDVGLGYKDPADIPERHRPYVEGSRTVGSNIPFMALPFALPAKAAMAGGTQLIKAGTAEAPAVLQPGGIVSSIIQSAKTNPGSFLTTEMIMSMLSGLGGGVAEKIAPGDPTVRVGLEVAAPFLTPGAFLLRSTGLIKHQVQNIRAKLSHEGRMDAAAEALQGEMKMFRDDAVQYRKDYEKAISNIQKEGLTGENIFAGTKSGDPVLIALQQRAIKENPHLSKKEANALKETSKAIQKAAEEAILGGKTDIVRELAFWQQRLFLDTLAETVAKRTALAKETGRRITTGRTKESISKRNREILEQSYTTGREGETAVWRAVPDDVEVASPEQLDEMMAMYQGLTDIIEPSDVPPYLRAFMDRIERFTQQQTDRLAGQEATEQAPTLAAEAEAFTARRAAEGGEEAAEEALEIITSGELKQLRSKLLRLARNTRDAPKNISYAMNEMANSILDSFGNLGMGQVVDEARAFSKQFNTLFTKGEVGELLGYTRKGDVKVAPGLTLEKGIAKGGTESALTGKAMERAAQLQGLPNRPAGMSDSEYARALSGTTLTRRTTAVEQGDFLKALSRGVDPDTGRVDSEFLKGFIRQHEDILRRFPRFRRHLKDAKTAEELLRRLETHQEKQIARSENQSLFAQVSGYENPSDAIGSVLTSKTPLESYGELIRVAKEGGPDAVDGLRTATFDYIFTNSMKNDMLSAKEIGNILTYKPSTDSGDLLGLMTRHNMITKAQAKRFEFVLERMAHIEKAMEHAGQLGLKLEDPNMLEDLLARLIGSNLAGSSAVASNTGSSLLLAHAGSRYMRKILNELPIEAIHKIIDRAVTTDPELLVQLLARKVTPRSQAILEQKLEAFLLSAGTRYIAEEEKKPEGSSKPPVFHKGGLVGNPGFLKY